MKRLRFAVFAALLTALVLPAATASAASVTAVTPGHSIQAAIDAAPVGGIVVVSRGTYRENLLITKSVRLIGHGAVLRPPTTATENFCSLGGSVVSGVCVLGDVTAQGQVTRPVNNVRVEGMHIAGFSGMGLFAIGVNRFTAIDNTFAGNGDYGIFVNQSSHVTILDSVSRYNGAPGIYIGDSPASDATVVGNSSYGNLGEGILFRDALGGRITRNSLHGNCAGMLVVDTGAPGAAGNVSIALNEIWGNNRLCPGEEGEAPPMGGHGVVLAGAQHVILTANFILNNVGQQGSGLPGGGVILIDSTPFGGTAPTNNSIHHNVLSGNAPNDLLSDGTGSGNTFTANSCTTSTPPGSC